MTEPRDRARINSVSVAARSGGTRDRRDLGSRVHPAELIVLQRRAGNLAVSEMLQSQGRHARSTRETTVQRCDDLVEGGPNYKVWIKMINPDSFDKNCVACAVNTEVALGGGLRGERAGAKGELDGHRRHTPA